MPENNPYRAFLARQDRLLAGVVMVAAFILYLTTLAPATLKSDLSEYQFVLAEPGIPHPTGYPLYVLLGHLWSYLPIGSVAYRVNLLSAVLGALTVAVLYLLLRQLRLPLLLALAVAFFFMVTPTFWSEMLVAGSYPLNAFLFILLLYLALRYSQNQLSLEWLAVVYGLALTHHRTMILLIPAWLTFLLATGREQWHVKRVLRLLFWLGLPLLLYAYIPLRAAQLGRTDLQTLDDLLAYLTGRTFSGLLFAEGWSGLPERVAGWWRWQRIELTLPALLLAAIGLYQLWRKERAFFFLTAVAFIAYISFNLNYYIGNIRIYYIPTYLLLAVWLGVGSQALVEQGQRVTKKAAVAWLLLAAGSLSAIALWRGVKQYEAIDQSQNYAMEDLWFDAFALPLPPASAVLTDWNEHTSLVYYQRVEQQRRDVIPLIYSPENLTNALNEQPHVFTLAPPGNDYYLANRGPLIEVRTTPRPLEEVTTTQMEPIRFTAGVTLLGYDFTYLREDALARPRYLVTFYWTLDDAARPVEEISLSLRLYRDGTRIGQTDYLLMDGFYPPSRWQPGEMVLDQHVFVVEPAVRQLPAAFLGLVLYNPSDLTAYPVVATGSGEADLGEISLEPTH